MIFTDLILIIEYLWFNKMEKINFCQYDQKLYQIVKYHKGNIKYVH